MLGGWIGSRMGGASEPLPAFFAAVISKWLLFILTRNTDPVLIKCAADPVAVPARLPWMKLYVSYILPHH